MKYIITLVLIVLFFSGQILAQEKNKVIQSPYESLIKKLNDFYHLNKADGNNYDEKELFAFDSRNNKLFQILKNLEDKFNSAGESIDKNTRTISSERMLGEGFLQVESISQSWDGTNWVNSSRSTNVYDAKNNRVQSTYQTWNVSVWENSYRYSYIYDVNNNQTEYAYQSWNGTAWVNSSRYLYTYNVNNDVTRQISQTWNGSAWVDYSQYLYTYDLNNDLTLQLYQTWSGTAWTDYSRRTYTYDSNHNQLEQVSQNWSGTAWVNQYKYISSYDANNNLIQQIFQNWDGTSWVNSSKYNITYNVNNKPIEYIFQSWDVTVWKYYFKYTFTYNSNNDPIELLAQQWNVTVWENYAKNTLTYDSNNNNTEQLSQTWSGTAWVNNYKYLYTYAPATTIKLNSPNGGEKWAVGTTRNITWTSSNISNIKLQYSTNNGTSWISITNVSASAGSYSWAIPNTISANCKVLISDVSNALIFDASDSVFSITPAPSVIVTAPNGGESWNVGSSYSITWTSISIDTVKIDYSTNNGTTWINVVSSTPSDGSYNWTIPNTPSANCRVQVSDVTNALVNDQSNNLFTIIVPVTPFINVSSPNGGEIWEIGSVHSITWTSNNVANVKIDYSTNNGTNWINIIASTTASAGSYSWTIPSTPSANCRVQISDVTNALINDQSNNLFTISTPVTPVISVTSPNGGENWAVGSVHNITWVSSNVTNVKIDYSTNNGTSWTNIIASTTASAGSYSWTVPNTVSTNCKVQISDVSNALINDQSNAVFTIFIYSSTITLNTNYSFGDPTKTASYQIIGLPGANNKPIAEIVTGTPGANGDWRAFWDSGTGDYTEYSSGSTFNFTPGKAFWVVSKNQISVNITNVSTVALAGDNTYSIPIHKGWNLISNPFDKSISWSSVLSSNPGENQPIYHYQSGIYISPNPTLLEPYKGYYFKSNDSTLTSLKIPYTTSTALPKQNSVSSNELEITLTADAVQKGFISVGVSEDAKPGVDMLDIFSPPSQFCEVNISLYNKEMETNYKYLQKDFRPEIGEGQEFDFSVKNISDQTLDMVVSGLDNYMDYEIFLLDKNLSKLYDLKKLNSFEVKRNTTQKEYSLLIGTEEFILQKKSDIMPTEFSLFQNYPNPFNPATRIMFSLPLQSNVSLRIYNILGELAAELINNQAYDAGYHEVTFDGSKFASGTYLYRLQTSSAGKQPFVEIKKMILIK